MNTQERVIDEEARKRLDKATLKSGRMDRVFYKKYQKDATFKRCPNGHLVGPNAKVCWKCGEEVK